MTVLTEVDASEPQTPVEPSSRLLRRLLRKPVAAICIAYLTLVVLVAAIAPLVLPDVMTERSGDLAQVAQLPSGDHWLGTDSLGRDIFDRLLVGARVSMIGVVQALVVVLTLAVPMGLAAGYLGGRFDRVVSWVTDLMLALPGIVLILAVLAVFPRSMAAAMITLGVLAAPGLARVVRSAVLPVREELYIAAAQVSGLSDPYIIRRHVLPRVAGPIIVQTSLLAATALTVQAGLAFLGLVVKPPAPSWGGMIAEGIQTMVTQPWMIWPPGIVLALTTVAFGLLGDAVQDARAEGWSRRRGGSRRRTTTSLIGDESNRSPEVLLSVQDLGVAFHADHGRKVDVVQHTSFDIRQGEVLGLVGESGCGKSATAMAIIGGLAENGEIVAGRIEFAGKDLASLSERELGRIRGREIAVISQEPMVSLDPVFRVGWQLEEVVRRHTGKTGKEVRAQAIELLHQVRLPHPEDVLRRYPHELSGGMAQRVVIARALAGEPQLLIADEPTTALDVTVQAEILHLLRTLQQERQMAILLITHDWGVVADICDRAVVMYAGQVVERADVESVFESPMHPYTAGLLASNPQHAKSEWLPTIAGSVPRPGSWPQGCHFQDRCPFVADACRSQEIPLVPHGIGHEARCIRSGELVAAGGWARS